MSSISVSDYRTHFQEFVEEVAKRPSMYVRNLAELQLLLLGYEAAFRAVVGGHSDAFFHRQFSD